MPGNRGAFEEALKRGSSSAWNEEWDKAAEEYRLALEEFPQDSQARGYLAMALYRSGRLTEALEIYQILWRAEPDNASALKRVTELQEMLGDRESAAAGHRVLAALHARQGEHEEALKSWQRAVQLRPDNLALWDSLMDAAVQVEDVASVLPGYLGAASLAAQHGQMEDALRLAGRAASLAPDDHEAVALLSALRVEHGSADEITPAGEKAGPEPEEEEEVLPPSREDTEPAQTEEEEVESLALADGEPTQEEEETPPEDEEVPPEDEEVLPEDEEVLPEEEDSLPENVVRFIRPLGPGDEPIRLPRSISTFSIQPPHLVDAHEQVDAYEDEEERSVDAGPEEVVPAATAQAGTETTDLDLPALEPPQEVYECPSEDSPAAEAEGPQRKESTGTEYPLEMPEEAPDSSKSADGGTTSPYWGSGVVDFGLDEAPEAVAPKPEGAADPRPQQGRGLLGRMLGFIWQPGEGDQDRADVPVLPETPAGQEGSEQGVGGAIDFGLAEAPKADRQRAERSHHWGIKDFGLAEASAEVFEDAQDATGAEAPVAEGLVDPSREDATAGDALEAGPAEGEDVRGEMATSVDDLPEEASPQPEVGDESIWVSTEDLTPAGPVELAESYLQMGKTEEALEAYRQALDADPDMVGALVGMARLHLFSENLEAATEEAKHALEVSLPAGDADALDLLLEVLRERAARGELGVVVEIALWLRSSLDVTALAPPLAESLLAMPVDLLGRTAGEHLEEVELLSPEVREECIAALQAAEEHLRRGRLRCAADETFRMLITQPDFLPAQSLLGRVLVAQGRLDEARDRVDRLVRLYELRGEETRALGVLWWAVAQRVVHGDARSRLAGMLRSQLRLEEAELIELGWVEPSARSSSDGGSVSWPERASAVSVEP